MRRACFAWAALCLVGLSCARRPPGAAEVTGPGEALRPVPLGDAPPLLDGGDTESLTLAIDRSLVWLERQLAERELVFGPSVLSARELHGALAEFRGLLADDPAPAVLAERVAARYELLEAAGGRDGLMLVTGYYEPLIAASPAPSEEYAVPIYSRPSDLIEVRLGDFRERFAGERIAGRLDGQRLVPYWSRGELERKRPLAGRGLELAWARSTVDLFVVEVQGSGVLEMPDGEQRRIGYASSNGWPYRSIGKLLIDEARIDRERMSMQAIRAYLAEHPEEIDRVLAYNESKVFFRFLEGPAEGALGQPVTPLRSIATDLSLFPRAALAFLVTDVPELSADGRVTSGEPLRRFVLNQDAGGAIRGAGRVDLFWGLGAEAELRAGLMRQTGRLFFLVPRGARRGAVNP